MPLQFLNPNQIHLSRNKKEKENRLSHFTIIQRSSWSSGPIF